MKAGGIVIQPTRGKRNALISFTTRACIPLRGASLEHTEGTESYYIFPDREMTIGQETQPFGQVSWQI